MAVGSPDLRLFDLHNTPPLVLHRMDKPVICALNGAAAGYGMDMALGCDIRIASDQAKLGAVFVRRGVLPESGGTWYLPRLVGWAKAAEIAFMGDVLDAERSLELGLVNRVVPHDQLMDEVAAVAARIASNAPYSVQATKRMMRLGMDETFETAVDHTYPPAPAHVRQRGLPRGHGRLPRAPRSLLQGTVSAVRGLRRAPATLARARKGQERICTGA